MRAYLVPFLFYLLLRPALGLFLEEGVAYAFHVALGLVLLALYWRRYGLQVRWDTSAVFAGIAIGLMWIPLAAVVSTGEGGLVPQTPIELAFRLLGFLILAPLVEELFTRGLLIKLLIAKDWEKVADGTFTWTSFLVTTAFFGLAHGHWLAGLMAGVALNLVWYWRRSTWSAVVAHAAANATLAIIILTTGATWLW